MNSQGLPLNIFLLAYYVIFVGLHLAMMLGIFLEWLREKKALKKTTETLPTVSVIIPVHNERCRIERLLESLKAQEYPNAEFIFIDDRSEDESAKLIGAFID